MDIKKLFGAAAAAGIEHFEARIVSTEKLTVALFDGTLENFTVAQDCTLKVRGTVGGRAGVFTSDRVDDEVIPLAVAALKQSAEYGNALDPELFVDGGKYEYPKVDTYHSALEAVTSDKFIELAKSIAACALSDNRIAHANTEVEYECGSVRIVNSHGLDVSGKTNYATAYLSVNATADGEVQSGSHYEFLTDIGSLDAAAFAKSAVDDAVGQLGGKSVATGKYDVVYSPDCVGMLVKTLCEGFSAFNAEKHMSLLENKIGKQTFSPELTVCQTPVGNDVFCSAFDDEGVPHRNMPLIDKGVPTGFVYDLDTARRAGTQSTGNGKLVGGNIRPAVGYVTVESGESSRQALFELVKNGLYITELNGAHAGLDPQSGNYSLQASGYEIKDGKLARAVSLITVAGNIITDFANVIAVGNDAKLTYYAVKTPSVAVRGMAVSGLNNQ